MSRWQRFGSYFCGFPADVIVITVIAFCYLYYLVYVPSLNNPNENTRIYLTQAIVENGSISIGRKEQSGKKNWKYTDFRGKTYSSTFINDIALVCDDSSLSPPKCAGSLYAAKAPGNSLLAIPVYGLLHAVGATDGRPLNDAGVVWSVRIWGVVFPAVAFLVFMLTFLRQLTGSSHVARLSVVGLGLGTLAWPYSIMVASHYLQGASLFAAWAILFGVRNWSWSPWWLVLSGFLAGFAVLLDYPAALTVIIMSCFVLVIIRPIKWVFAFAGGALGPALFHVWYHMTAFGSPAATGHYFLETAHNRASQSGGFLGIESPSLTNLYGTFFSPEVGMFFLSPWLAVGLVGLVWWVASRGRRAEVVLALVTVAAYGLFVISLGKWRTMLGWTIGPRYLAPAVPFLTLGFAWLLAHWPRQTVRHRLVLGLGATLIAVSVFHVMVSTITYPQFNPKFTNPIYESGWALFKDNVVSQSITNLAGIGGWTSTMIFLVPLAGLVSWLLVQSLWTASGPASRPWTWRPLVRLWALRLGVVVLSAGLGFGLVWGAREVKHTPTKVLKPLLSRTKDAVRWYLPAKSKSKPPQPAKKKAKPYRPKPMQHR